jgi:hypothetical protein
MENNSEEVNLRFIHLHSYVETDDFSICIFLNFKGIIAEDGRPSLVDGLYAWPVLPAILLQALSPAM